MDRLRIHGPANLNGRVKVSRAKNAYLPILASVLLSDKTVCLKDLPELRDINTILNLLQKLGVEVVRKGNETYLNAGSLRSVEATYDLVKTMRASILVLGPLLARFKKAKVSLPGGCAIGARPIDIHLNNLAKLGAEIKLDGGYVEAKTDGLRGEKLVLNFPSVGATENLMMAGVLAEGTTIIENAALEPEIIDLADFLNAMGGKVSGAGTKRIVIEGVESLKEVTYEAIGDRIEAATYIMAALITESEIIVEDINPIHLDSVLSILKEMGGKFEVGPNYIKVLKSKLHGMKIDTAPFPGFPTDAQAQLMALATQVQGPSIISEKIFENRFMHVPELKRLGAKIELEGKTAFIEGKTDLNAAPIMCTDLRASAALVLAALATNGTTEIHRIYHLDRGYEKLHEKLGQLGVKIERVDEQPTTFH